MTQYLFRGSFGGDEGLLRTAVIGGPGEAERIRERYWNILECASGRLVSLVVFSRGGVGGQWKPYRVLEAACSP